MARLYGLRGTCELNFSQGLPDLFMEHDVDALQGQETKTFPRIAVYGKAKPITISFAVNNIIQLLRN